jgi:hypothetical protein
MSGDIGLCVSDGDVLLCLNRDIELCATNCADPPELFMEGSDAPIVGTEYTATGGVAPYVFTMDGGTITTSVDTGTVATITSCGGSLNNGAGGTVTVTDACAQTKSIIVRLTGGRWSQISSEEIADFYRIYGAYFRNDYDTCLLTDYDYIFTLPNAYKVTQSGLNLYYVKAVWMRTDDTTLPAPIDMEYLNCVDSYGNTSNAFIWFKRVYEWIC